MHMIMSHKKWSLLAFVGVLALTGTAAAYFTGGGTGSGTAAVGTSGAVVLTATVPGGITPGNSEPVSFVAANPTGSGIDVTTVHLESVSVDGGNAACVTADFTMPDVTEGPDEVAAGATAQALTVGGVLSYADTALNQDGCKGATITLALTST